MGVELKATGLTRQIDSLGRIVIPKDLREKYELTANDSLEMFTTEDGILIRKYNPGCTLCGGLEGIQTVRGKYLCKHCIETIKKEL